MNRDDLGSHSEDTWTAPRGYIVNRLAAVAQNPGTESQSQNQYIKRNEETLLSH